MTANQLELRGALNLLARAASHATRGHAYREFGDGTYYELSVEQADGIFRRAMWEVEADLRTMQKGTK